MLPSWLQPGDRDDRVPRLISEDERVVIASAREALLRTFQWESGHANVWRIFADGDVFAAVVAGLVEPWRTEHVTKVLGIEARGFLLGGAASLALASGFVAVRKSDGLLPGPKLTLDTEPDYRGRRHHLRMQAVLTPDDRVLMVDDWAERGSQARAARQLVASTGATFLGLSVLVDQLTDEARSMLGTVTSLANADELGPSS
jgi:adenine phosphoribosyltransferase